MRRRFVGAAMFLLVLPMTAAAQDTTQQTTTTTTTTTYQTDDDLDTRHQWLGSAFIGSSFGQDADDVSVDFGGTIGYLRRGIVGGEFQANLAPDFELEPARRALLLGDTPRIDSYMFNAIAAVPIGDERRFQPYGSGRLGALTLRSDVLDDPNNAAVEPDDSRLGANIGGGGMGFWGSAGLRADVRYFRGFDEDAAGDQPGSPTEITGSQVLSNLNVRRANIDGAFTW